MKRPLIYLHSLGLSLVLTGASGLVWADTSPGRGATVNPVERVSQSSQSSQSPYFVKVGGRKGDHGGRHGHERHNRHSGRYDRHDAYRHHYGPGRHGPVYGRSRGYPGYWGYYPGPYPGHYYYVPRNQIFFGVELGPHGYIQYRYAE